MSQLDEMRAFAAVVDTLSITAAAERLGQSKQLVSRRLQSLEERLGVRLLNRTTRRIQPTALGIDYVDRVRDILARIDDAEQEIGLQREEVRGILRVSAPMSFTLLRLRALIPAFLKRYSKVDLVLELSDRRVDLLAEGYDMAIRIGDLSDSTLIARPLCSHSLITCASPEYLARHGTPERPEQLRDHHCLLYGHHSHVVWRYRRQQHDIEVVVEGRFHTNNGELVRDAAVSGMGIVQLPPFIVDQALQTGQLVTVLDNFRPSVHQVSAVFPQHRQASRAVRALVDALVVELGGA